MMTLKFANYNKVRLILLTTCAALLLSVSAFAATYNFEDGSDGEVVVQETVPGVEFFPTGGRNWIYGDWRTGAYNEIYRPMDPDNPTEWDLDNNIFAWLGVEQDTGKINFSEGATYFAMSYSSQDILTLSGYNSMGQMVDVVTGNPTLAAGEMDLLRVESDDLMSVIIGDGNRANYWIVDNIDTDAFIADCLIDPDCDDGVFCNGAETCNTTDYVCELGEIPCQDDGEFCNGEEYCDEEIGQCSADPPCDEGQTCNEDGDFCVDIVEPDPEEPAAPDQEVVGGACCACE